MPFNSYFFIFIFLPITLVFFFIIGRKNHSLALAWLVGASLVFYGCWNPLFLIVIICSILFNYCWGTIVERGSKILLVIGIIINLALLGFFKYANFLSDNLMALMGWSMALPTIILPLAISFYTFQQIAYLVDAYRGQVKEHDFLKYLLFVTFFPRLIQGPITYYQEMASQIKCKDMFRLNPQNLAVGMTIFFFGLFKKIIIADGLAMYATPVFEAARHHYALSFLEAWEGALAYTLQIYFDFSGYSDMAIGTAYLFGIRIPLNFHSPYQSLNIIDFWRRWHISLSRFLRDYLYIPLGGNRHGEVSRFLNLMITMLLGGLWHGAAWTFVLWGGLHGLFLVANHGWIKIKKYFGYKRKTGYLGNFVSGALTFIAVAIAWVFFRADSVATGFRIVGSMAGQNGFALPEKYLTKFGPFMSQLKTWGIDFREMNYFEGSNEVVYIVLALLVVWFAPNVQQMMNRYKPYLNIMSKKVTLPDPPTWLLWRPSLLWMSIMVICALMSIFFMSRAGDFIYFQF